jgi:hypothetical protein
MGFLGIKFPEGFTPLSEVVGNEVLMLYSPATGKIHQSELGLLPFGIDEQAVIDLVNTNTSVNVYNAARLGGQLPSYYAPASSLTNYYTKTQSDDRYSQLGHTHTFASLTSKPSTLSGFGITDAYNQSYINSNFININQKGVVNGVATLDGGAKIPISQIPDSVVGQVSYEGTWNASTNTPSLPPVPAEKGHYYVVSAAGTQFGISFQTGDWIISNGSVWQKVDNTDAVMTVFGRLGNIVANATDYNAFYLRHDTASQSLTSTQRSNARTNLDVYSTTQITEALALKVNKAGDTMTNKLTISNSNYLSHLDLVRGSIKFEFAPSTANGGELRFLATNATQYIFDKKMAVGGSNVESGYMIDVNGNLIVRGNIIAQGEITAYATGSSGSMWDGMPVATATTLGGVMVSPGSGLKMVGSQLEIDGDTFNLNNYYTKTNIDAFFAGTTSKTGYNKSNWDAAYSWGNHNSAGYLTSFTETDPTVPPHVKAITTTNISNWNTAYTNNLRWSGTATGLDAVAGRASLDVAQKQSSTTDSEAGKGLIVGAFGLGTTGIVSTETDVIAPSYNIGLGAYLTPNGGLTNLPSGWEQTRYNILSFGQSSYKSQLIFRNDRIAYYGYDNTWYQLYHTGNLVNPVTGTGTSGQISYWDGVGSQTGSSNLVWDNASGLLSLPNGTSGRGVAINNIGIRFVSSPTGGWTMALNSYDSSGTLMKPLVGVYGGANSHIYTYIGGSRYNDAAIYAHPDNRVSINKTSVTSGYMLDVNGAIRAAGNIYATGNITGAGEVTAYTASDARLKTNITSLAHINALDIINALNPVTYTWNDRAVKLNGNKNTSTINYGLIAQELEAIVPDLIRPIYGDYKTYDDRGLMTLVIQAVKQLKAGWDDSKKEVNELKEELMRLKNKN